MSDPAQDGPAWPEAPHDKAYYVRRQAALDEQPPPVVPVPDSAGAAERQLCKLRWFIASVV